VATARPVRAALTSAATFAVGATLPLLSILAAPGGAVIPTVAIAALVALIVLGVVGARAGGADLWRGGFRVSFWGALAMAATAAIGALFGVAV
jgi:vacuolar iron transporter family protein